VRWKILLVSYLQMTSGYDTERIIKIGQLFAEVTVEIKGAQFFFDSVYIAPLRPKTQRRLVFFF